MKLGDFNGGGLRRFRVALGRSGGRPGRYTPKSTGADCGAKEQER